MNYKNRIEETLNKKGMSAAELSRQAGIAKSNISKWLSQQCQPRENALQKIAEILDADVDWLRGMPQNPGNRIKEALNKKGMSAAELAARMGVSKACISGWTSQQWQPKKDALQKIAEILDADIDWLRGVPVDSESLYLINQIDKELVQLPDTEDTERLKRLLKRTRKYLLQNAVKNEKETVERED